MLSNDFEVCEDFFCSNFLLCTALHVLCFWQKEEKNMVALITKKTWRKKITDLGDLNHCWSVIFLWHKKPLLLALYASTPLKHSLNLNTEWGCSLFYPCFSWIHSAHQPKTNRAMFGVGNVQYKKLTLEEKYFLPKSSLGIIIVALAFLGHELCTSETYLLQLKSDKMNVLHIHVQWQTFGVNSSNQE